METFKSPVARLARLFQTSRDAWKAKALDKQRRLRAAQVKIRDLEASRAQWKARALAAEAGRRDAETTAGTEADEPDGSAQRLARLSPAGHHHSLLVMQLTLQMYLSAGLGSRGVPRILHLLAPWFPVGVPAYTTVLNWVYRCGLAVLQRPPERREDWIYVVDHTLALGVAKCLVILGIPASRLVETGYSPRHQAMQVLAVAVTEHSTGAWVAARLWEVAQRTGLPLQIVADHGSDLLKGITLFQQDHAPACVETYDISHRIATLLKADLTPDARWKAFLAHARATLASFQQTDLAFLLPPRQRTKARFMHFEVHVEWAQQVLAYADRGDFSAIRRPCVLSVTAWEHLRGRLGTTRVQPLRPLIGYRYPDKTAFSQTLQAASDLTLDDLDDAFWDLADTGRARFLEGFAWVRSYRDDLVVYAQMMAQSKAIQAFLKSEGLHAGVCEPLRAILAPPAALTPRAADFTDRILAQVAREAAKIPSGQTWLASSDIIESVFGKYKTFTSRSPLKEVGRLVLAIPAFITDLTTSVIRDAMESVRTLDVERWVKTHLGDSMLARRRQAFRMPAADTETA
jgi:rhodanese-related sulfurtransferase